MRWRKYLAACSVAAVLLVSVPQTTAAPHAPLAAAPPVDASSSPADESLDETAAPVPAADVPDKLTVDDLYDRIATNSISAFGLTQLLTLIAVMLQQAGFSVYERGLASDARMGLTWRRNYLVIPLAALAFWAYGFAIGWGNCWSGPVAPGWVANLGAGLTVLNHGVGIGPDPATPGLFRYGLAGAKGFFLTGTGDISAVALFAFMLPFVITALTIPGGAMAQRWSLKNSSLYCLWAVLPFSLYANWIWGGGWLAQSGLNWGLGHGVVDFAGSGVVHALGGMIALAGCLAIGPRDKRVESAVPQTLAPQTAASQPAAPQTLAWQKTASLLLGTLVLIIYWGGWDIRLPLVVNLLLAGHAGAIGAILMAVVVRSKITPATLCRGFLSGIVACTAACTFVDRLGAAAIGAVAGPLAELSLRFWERRGIDDVTGAISVNGVGGLWGLIALGLFANGQYGSGWNGVLRNEWAQRSGFDAVRGLIYGDASQLIAQLLAAGVVVVFGFGTAYAGFRLSNRIVPLRLRDSA